MTAAHRSRTRLGTAVKNVARLVRPQVHITPPPAGVVFERDVPVPVRDGTVLQANVFRPEAAGGYPVLLSLQPYGKDKLPKARRRGYAVPLQYRLAAGDEPMTVSAWTGLEAPDPGFWVPRGYVVINADLRGWGASAGRPEPFAPTEGQDVHDVVEWAAVQPWSSGKVGMSGVSYLAISQWTGAATRPPHLAAINPWEGFTDAYRDFAYPGGIREDGFMVLWSAWQTLMRPRSPSFRRGQRAHPLRDGWWEQRTPALEWIDVPALVCASFSDHSLHSRGSFTGFERISSEHKWLYTHRAPKWPEYYGPRGQRAQMQFFDHFLKGEDTGILDTAPVRVEVRDALRAVVAVRGAGQWPPADVRADVLHLDACTGTLGPQAPTAATSALVPRAGAQFRYRFDRTTDVVGPLRLRVNVSIDGTGADTGSDDLTLFAGIRKVRHGREVVFEGSYGFTEDLVTRGWLRASHRGLDPERSSDAEAYHLHTSPMPLAAGTPVDLDLTLLPSATRFAAGDELVLELRDRWFFPTNPLTGQFPAIYEHSPAQDWRIHTGPGTTGTLTVPTWDATDPPEHPTTSSQESPR